MGVNLFVDTIQFDTIQKYNMITVFKIPYYIIQIDTILNDTIWYDTNLFVTLQLIRLGSQPFQFSLHPSDNLIYVLVKALYISISISNRTGNLFVTLELVRPGLHPFQFNHSTAKFAGICT